MFTNFGGADLDLARERRRQIAREVRENRLERSLRSAPGSMAWGVAGFLPRVGARYGSR